MKFDLRTIQEFPARVRAEEPCPEWDLTSYGLSLTGPLTLEMNIVKSDRIYYFNGWVEARGKLQCARCLTEFEANMRGSLEFSVQEAADPKMITTDDIPDTEIVVAMGQTEIDLDGPIKEALILEIPLKPLCNENCRGICPLCGIDRNQENCDCKPENTDPRWEGLRQFSE